MTAEEYAHWRKLIEDFIVNDIRILVGTDRVQVGLILLCMIGIDALGGYLAGSQSNSSKTFVSFISTYFPPLYAPFADQIWKLRSSLLHDYVTNENDNFVLDHHEKPHLTPVTQGNPVWFNRRQFALDFIRAWEDYALAVQSDASLQEKVKRRVRQRGILIFNSIS